MKIRFFYRILKREGGKRGIIMEVNNHVKAGYMPGREKRASGSQGKDFSAKMSDVLAQKEEKQDGAAENPRLQVAAARKVRLRGRLRPQAGKKASG